MSMSSSIQTPLLPFVCWSADCFDWVWLAAFGSRPRLGLQAVNVVEIKSDNGDYRGSFECRFA